MFGTDLSIIIISLPLLGKGLLVTLQITILAVLVGMALGTVLAVGRISDFAPLRWLATTYITVFRSVPLVMVLLWFYLILPQLLSKILGLSSQADIRLASAMVAFSMFEAAYYAEIIRAGINSISRDQYFAALALGMTKGQALIHVLLPQAFRVMTPLLLTQGIILFQDTALVYIIGVGDFFRTASNIGKTTGYEIDMVLLAGAGYFIICFFVSLLVKKLKRERFT